MQIKNEDERTVLLDALNSYYTECDECDVEICKELWQRINSEELEDE